MKRIALLLFLIMILLSGCKSSQITYINITHNRTQFYPYIFDAYSTSNSYCELNIFNIIYEKELANQLLRTVSEDVKKVNKVVGQNAIKPIIYIVPEDNNYPLGVFDGKVYCTTEDITEGTYYQDLMVAMFSIYDTWKLIGLETYIFGNDDLNITELKNYYSQVDDLDILSLFYAYFIDVFVTQEQMQIANDTAKSFTRYVIKDKGIDTLLNSDCYNNRQDWLAYIGIDREYIDPYYGYFDGYQFQTSEEYPLVVTTSKGDVFHIKPLTNDVETPAQIKEFLYNARESVKAVLNYIEKNAPKYYEDVLNNYKPLINYYFVDNNAENRNAADGQKITLQNSSVFLHETVHILIPFYDTKERLQSEGIAEYLAQTIYPMMDNASKKRWFTTLKEKATGVVAYDLGLEMIQQYYSKYTDIPTTFEDLDVTLIERSVAVTSLAYPEFKQYLGSGYGRSIGELAQLPIGDRDLLGNELTYPEAFLVTDYLVKEYGMSKVMEYCDDHRPFFKVFGKDYHTVKDELIAKLILELN